MYNFSKPDSSTYQEMQKIVSTANEMLGPQSQHLINDKMLLSEKAKTNFTTLQKSRAQFYLLTPAQIQAERMKQFEQEQLAKWFGSDIAKAIVSNPVYAGIRAFATQGNWFISKINSGSFQDIAKEGVWK